MILEKMATIDERRINEWFELKSNISEFKKGSFMEFMEYLVSQKILSDRLLKEFLDKKTKEAKDIDPEFGWSLEKITSLITRGGKRARSLLVRLTCELTETELTDENIRASVFVELVHDFLLIHDDVADQDLKRYGGPTMEIEYQQLGQQKFRVENSHFGKTMAMIAGDHVLTLAHQLLLESGIADEKKIAIEKQMMKTLTETFAGWQIQYWMNFKDIENSDPQLFLKGMELVSAKYTFEAPLMIGLILGGRLNDFKSEITKYAYHTGMAFQIQDDILGVFGDTKATGKPVGNDLREGKKTLLILHAYKQANEKDKAVIKACLGSDSAENNLEEIRDIIVKTGSLSYSQQMANDHIDQAIETIGQIKGGSGEAKVKLKKLAEYVISRDH
jgi:geranylgeranyl diphosphate synthase type I